MHGFRVCTPQKMRNTTTLCLSLYFQSCQENHVRVKKPHTGEFRLRRWALCCWGTNYPQNLKGIFAKSPNWACFHLICSIKSTTLCSVSYVGGTNWTFYWWRSCFLTTSPKLPSDCRCSWLEIQELTFSHLFSFFQVCSFFMLMIMNLTFYIWKRLLMQVRSPFVLDNRTVDGGFHTCNSDVDQGEMSLCTVKTFLTNVLTLLLSPVPFELNFVNWSQGWRKKRKEKNKNERTKMMVVK